MSEDQKQPAKSTRRTVLRLAGASLPAFATFRASAVSATATTSLMTCTVPFAAAASYKNGVPQSYGKDQWITAAGNLVTGPTNRNQSAPWTTGGNAAYPPLDSGGYYSGQELKNYIDSGTRPTNKKMSNGQYSNSSAFDAHAQYLTKVRYGTASGPGMTCLMSVFPNA